MPTITRRTQPLVIAAFFLFIVGCGKNSPTSFIDDYKPPYTDAGGTVFEGDYFPLATGNQWDYSGEMIMNGSLTMAMMGTNQIEPIDDTTTVSSKVTVGTQESLVLSGGTYMVYPVTETSEPFDATTNPETTTYVRYFENKNEVLNIRAVKTTTNNIVEITNPVFIKKPLVVGERWSAEPFFDIQSIMDDDAFDMSALGGGTPEVEMKIQSEFFVIGNETVDYKGTPTATVRLDQKSDVTIKINMPLFGTIDMNLKMTTILNFIKDIGIVQQIDDGTLTMNGSITMEGITVKLKSNSTLKDTLSLGTFTQLGNGTTTIASNFGSLGKRTAVSNEIRQTLESNGIPSVCMKLCEKIMFLASKTVF